MAQLDQTVDGNGKGYQRLYKNPAVLPPLGVSVLNITNNINVISTSYAPSGINIHFQTPFGIGEDPVVRWGYKPDELSCNATGKTSTYDRTPPCSMLLATQCSQYFHHVTISESVHTDRLLLETLAEFWILQPQPELDDLLPDPGRQRHAPVVDSFRSHCPCCGRQGIFRDGSCQRHGLHGAHLRLIPFQHSSIRIREER